MAVFPLGRTTLILFGLGQTSEDQISERGTIPGHGPTNEVVRLLQNGQPLRQHFCLAADSVEDVKLWEEWFSAQGVKTLGVMNWEKGGRSVYFEDLDGHIGEVGSRGIWSHY